MKNTSKARHVIVGVRMPEALKDILRGIIAYVKENCCNWRVDCVDIDEFSDLLRRGLADGAISRITNSSDKLMKLVQSEGFATVNIIHDCNGIIPSVVADEFGTGLLAAEHLITRGYKNFAFIGFNAVWSRNRERGFVETISAAGMSCQSCPALSHLTYSHFLDEPDVARKVRQWLLGLPRPTAILACTDQTASAAIGIALAAKLRVPEDLAIIGVGNLVSTCELAPVPLSSVAVDFAGIGYHAARLLDGRMNRQRPSSRAHQLPPAGIVSRRSTDAFMFDNEHVRVAMKIIHDRAAGGLTIKELLHHVSVSRKWLDGQFKATIGRTPSVEMRHVRAERIRSLLVDTDLTIRQIALICGFSHAENLVRFFRDLFGVPPTIYRFRHSISRQSSRVSVGR